MEGVEAVPVRMAVIVGRVEAAIVTGEAALVKRIDLPAGLVLLPLRIRRVTVALGAAVRLGAIEENNERRRLVHRRIDPPVRPAVVRIAEEASETRVALVHRLCDVRIIRTAPDR